MSSEVPFLLYVLLWPRRDLFTGIAVLQGPGKMCLVGVQRRETNGGQNANPWKGNCERGPNKRREVFCFENVNFCTARIHIGSFVAPVFRVASSLRGFFPPLSTGISRGGTAEGVLRTVFFFFLPNASSCSRHARYDSLGLATRDQHHGPDRRIRVKQWTRERSSGDCLYSRIDFSEHKAAKAPG
jgi:hypothetical protein